MSVNVKQEPQTVIIVLKYGIMPDLWLKNP